MSRREQKQSKIHGRNIEGTKPGHVAISGPCCAAITAPGQNESLCRRGVGEGGERQKIGAEWGGRKGQVCKQ